jgi:uncharacterized membrane protein HdeD (DUF308 family)
VVAAWIAQLARGILAVALGVTISLTLEHSPTFGFLTFGAYALLSGILLLAAEVRGTYSAPRRGLFVPAGIASLVAAAVAVVFVRNDVATLGLLIGLWAVVTGLLEGASGILMRRASPLARDWILGGVFTTVLGVFALVLPSDVVQPFTGERGVAGTLTSSIILIGVLGAWAVITGVLQVISAISARGVRAPAAVAP